MSSVHDSHIRKYCVDSRERRIVIETEFPHSTPPTETSLIFEGVQAYFFQNDLMGTIIMDVTPTAIESITDRYKDLFEKNSVHGWPLGWEPKKESINDYFKRLALQAFELSSSYGMDGWIICRTMKYKNG